jgi:hypothetical protein
MEITGQSEVQIFPDPLLHPIPAALRTFVLDKKCDPSACPAQDLVVDNSTFLRVQAQFCERMPKGAPVSTP